MSTGEANDMGTLFTMFVLGTIMCSLMATPAIIAVGYARAWRRALKPGKPR